MIGKSFYSIILDTRTTLIGRIGKASVIGGVSMVVSDTPSNSTLSLTEIHVKNSEKVFRTEVLKDSVK
jgi:hypothetical protein